jgi:hypothetical protein
MPGLRGFPRVQDHIPERSYVVITRVEYTSPESGLYRFLKEGFVHNVLTLSA